MVNVVMRYRSLCFHFTLHYGLQLHVEAQIKLQKLHKHVIQLQRSLKVLSILGIGFIVSK